MASSTAAPAPLLVLAFLALASAAATAAAHDGDSQGVCEEADCGRGRCVPRLSWVPWRWWYKCECDDGWSRAIRMVTWSPCNVPDCSFNRSCVDLALLLPRGIPLSDDPCVAVNCGPGTCKKEKGFHYRCECDPGNANMLNSTKFPCVDRNCLMGMHCPALDAPAPPPAPATSSSPPPPGCVPGQSTLRRLLLVVVAVTMAQLM